MPKNTQLTQKLFFSATFALAVSIAPFVALSTPQIVFAAPEAKITAIPPRLELKANPGDTLTAELKVRNDFPFTQDFGITVEDFVVTDQIGTPVPSNLAKNSRWAMSKWISAPSSIPVDSQQTQIVRISIKVPRTALPGGHYALVTYTPNPDQKPSDLGKTGSTIAQRVGTIVYVTVSGAVTENASIQSFTTEKFQEQGPVNFKGLVGNYSDLHVNPKGSISIYSPLNTKVADLPVEVGNVFPETVREFASKWNQKWGYGRYRADLNLAYGTAGAVITATIFFWLFPIRLVIYSLVGIVSLLALYIIISKRNRKHQEDLEKEVQQLKKELEQLEKK